MTTPQRPNVWYKPVSQKDYPTVGQIGEVVIRIRVLPGIANGQYHESVFEKNTATSNYPGSKKWIVPVCVLEDQLHPELNGTVGIMDISKTLKNKIQGVDTPMNYYDLNVGHNFNIVVSLTQSRDGDSYFPDYGKSGYEAQPSAIDPNYVFAKMNELEIADFAAWARNLNDAISKKAQAASQGYSAPTGMVAPQATAPAASYTPGVPMTPMAPAAHVAPTFTLPVPQGQVAAPAAPAPYTPAAPTPVAPTTPGVPWEPAPQAPVGPQAPAGQAPTVGLNDFDSVFGTPAG